MTFVNGRAMTGRTPCSDVRDEGCIVPGQTKHKALMARQE